MEGIVKSINRKIYDFPTNIFKLNSIFVTNLYENYDREKFRKMFEKFGRIISIYHRTNTSFAVVHFDNQFSPIYAIAKWNKQNVDQISKGKLRIRFNPFSNQRECYYKMSYSLYKLIVNKHGECHYWRSGMWCPFDRNCDFKHLISNRNVDPLPKGKKFRNKTEVNTEKKRKPNIRFTTTKQILNALNNELIQ